MLVVLRGDLDHYKRLVRRVSIFKVSAACSSKKQHYSPGKEHVATDVLDRGQNLAGMVGSQVKMLVLKGGTLYSLAKTWVYEALANSTQNY